MKVFFRATGYGFGAAVGIAIAMGVRSYLHSLPERPKPWDRGAIKSTFGDIFIDTGDRLVLTFRYTVENKTRYDYYLPTDPKSLFIVMPDSKGLGTDDLDWDRGAYIPPSQKVSISFRRTYDYTDSLRNSDVDNNEKFSAFMSRRLKEFDGFVVLDKEKRYEITFPNGWKDGETKVQRVSP